MHILVLEASTTSAKAMLYNTEDGTFDVKVKAYTGNYDDVTIHKAENVYQHDRSGKKSGCRKED